MTNIGGEPDTGRRGAGPPVFNAPAIVLALILAFAAVQVIRSLFLTPDQDDRVILDFAFIAGCAVERGGLCDLRPAGAAFWSPFTYGFLHGDFVHLGLNTVWLLAFGTPVARRVGAARFLLLAAFGSAAGALAFYALHPDLRVPVIGASGVVSALMGGACRFAFTRPVAGDPGAEFNLPLLPIGAALRQRTVVFFVLVFFATNLLTGLGAGAFLDGGAAVAWEAHLGGFAFGFLVFRLFDKNGGRGHAPGGARPG